MSDHHTTMTLREQCEALEAELKKHGAGKCCTVGKTYTRPDFHIDPDEY